MNNNRNKILLDDQLLRKASWADTASERSNLYSLLVRAFGNLPDTVLLAEIRSPIFIYMSDNSPSPVSRIKSGTDLLKTFISNICGFPDSEILKELAADRTRLIRGLDKLALKLPGDKLIGNNSNKNASFFNITYFPLDAEELPEEEVSDLLDYLCIKLDFMDCLCRREQKQWSNGSGPFGTISQEADFLRGHLETWVAEFCFEAKQHSETDFYRGFLEILGKFTRADLDYLNNLVLSVR
jgi:hypothetical protein